MLELVICLFQCILLNTVIRKGAILKIIALLLLLNTYNTSSSKEETNLFVFCEF